MKKLYIHGLGQTPESWRKTLEQLDAENSECIDLVALLRGEEPTYGNLYAAFVVACASSESEVRTPRPTLRAGSESFRDSNLYNQNNPPVVLCGLSLGAVLALNYAGEYPQSVQALVLIAPQYKMPKGLLKVQNLIFRLMPRRAFRATGFSKADFIKLCQTMMEIDLKSLLPHIACPVLVICGERDTANKKSALELVGRLQNAELEIMVNVGHEVNREAPDQLASALKSFYESCLP